MASGFHFFYPKAWVCSLLLPVSFQHLRPSWVPFLPLSLACFWSPKESGEVPQDVFWRAGELWGNVGDPHSSFCPQHPGKIRQGGHTGREKLSRGIFMLFWLLLQLQISAGGSVHHQQQPFFFWGAFGTCSALFFHSSSRTLSNLMKLTMASQTLWPEAALHS